MTRTRVLREIRRMRFEEACGGWQERRPPVRPGERPLEETPWERGHLARGGLGCAAQRAPCGRDTSTPGTPVALTRPDRGCNPESIP